MKLIYAAHTYVPDDRDTLLILADEHRPDREVRIVTRTGYRRPRLPFTGRDLLAVINSNHARRLQRSDAAAILAWARWGEMPEPSRLCAHASIRWFRARLVPERTEARELIADLAAALGNVLLHQGDAMPAADRVQRAALVERAEAFIG